MAHFHIGFLHSLHRIFFAFYALNQTLIKQKILQLSSDMFSVDFLSVNLNCIVQSVRILFLFERLVDCYLDLFCLTLSERIYIFVYFYE